MASLDKIVREIGEQIEELNRLKGEAKLDSNQKFIQNEINRLSLVKQNHEKKQAELTSNGGGKTEQLGVITITNYMWDQSDEHIKIYIELNKTDKIENGEIRLEFSSDTKFTCIFGKYRFTLGRLFKPLDQTKSKAIITKSNRLVITLHKVKSEHWSSLQSTTGTTPKLMDDKPEIDSDDPQKSLMNLMKKMYDDGDDDMKRTIAKSWYESQNKQGLPDMP
ncbi:calcyclin-binding protein [Dermatophagoides pteronyssinus]|uniref:Calcyclin-binding protein-like n=2 Tax=Dermatophagoides pteronyssinus TaxID=6956 RepID=A0A6P6YH03_DERPT|nr:calcyclin-binding protein-like [Dermatophagoides pteronyssinus]KAH9426730.1 hypothetical protein DERP_002830 [Dermatophagoides pteronyssinus]